LFYDDAAKASCTSDYAKAVADGTTSKNFLGFQNEWWTTKFKESSPMDQQRVRDYIKVRFEQSNGIYEPPPAVDGETEEERALRAKAVEKKFLLHVQK
jgi:hypothetical protein